MRVLLAEQDLVTSTGLQRMLRNLGHEVEVVRDGLSAWKRLERTDAPSLAILDCFLPGNDPLDIIRKVRSHPFSRYIYIVTLASKGDGDALIESLEAGADSHLGLPVSPAELAAQLKAAQRIVQNEERHEKEIARLKGESPASAAPPSRHGPEVDLPQPLPSLADAAPPQPPPAESTDQVDEAKERPEGYAADAPAIPRQPAIRLEGLVPLARLQACFETVLRRIRYTAPEGANSDLPDGPDFTVCTAVVLEEERLWLDLKLEATHRVGEAVYRALMSEPSTSDAQLRDALEELCNMCQGAWKMAMESAGLQPMTPGWPITRYSYEIPQVSSERRLGFSSFTLPGPIRVTVIEQLATVEEKLLSSASAGDVLADPIMAPGQRIPLLHRGTAMNPRYISRIRELLDARSESDFKLRVIEPSPLVQVLQRRWPRSAIDLPLTVIQRNNGSDKVLRGRARDISENGLGAIIAETLSPGENVTLQFSFAAADCQVPATVRRREGCHYGFEFLSNPFADKVKKAISGMAPATHVS
jgi:CheY-like chemotaxis protein